jgi:enoyl-CoA hydratase/carnithine racemase
VTDYEHVLRETADGVATVTLNRPEVLNACEPRTHHELVAVFGELEADDTVGAVVLTGAGRAFCSGSDLRTVGELEGTASARYVELDFAAKNRIAGFGKPTIAAVHGYCVGGGFELALACDLRIAAGDAVFALPEIGLGTLPGAGGLQRLPPIVGLGIAKEWAMTGRQVDAAEAYRTGLINTLTEPAELLSVAQDLARLLASRSPTAMRYVKAALDPDPPSNWGLVAAYHGLASRACHDQPEYHRRSREFSADQRT